MFKCSILKRFYLLTFHDESLSFKNPMHEECLIASWLTSSPGYTHFTTNINPTVLSIHGIIQMQNVFLF